MLPEGPRSQVHAPRGPKVLSNGYSAQTVFIISHIEVQSPHDFGTWTLGGCATDPFRRL